MWWSLFAFAVLALGAACVLPPVVLVGRLRRYCRAFARAAPPRPYTPRALVIVPVKGIASEMGDLEANLAPVLEQDYPDYRVVFAIADERDLARPVLERLCARFGHATLVIAAPQARCSQKLSNQIRALRELGEGEQALVFLDSDARPGPTLLRELIAPLADAAVGVSTGFRWYAPAPGAGLGSWLRAAWNVGGLPFLVEPAYSYAWGGAMAIRREVFEGCQVAEHWRAALTDDMVLSALVKAAGYRVALAPTCLVASPESLGLAGTLEWTTRQTVICRVYNPRMWRDLLTGEALTAATLALALAALGMGLARGHALLAFEGAAVLAAVLASRALYQALVLGVVRQVAPGRVRPGDGLRLVGLTPAVHLLLLLNNLRSVVSRRITWRGIRYDLRGPQEVVVLPER